MYFTPCSSVSIIKFEIWTCISLSIIKSINEPNIKVGPFNELFLEESAKLRALRALVSYLPHGLRALVPLAMAALVPYIPCTLHALVPHVPCALPALYLTCLVPYIPRALRVLVSQMSYVLLYLTCLVPCVFLGCSCLELYVLLCFSSLTCFRCLYISCLVAFMSCASCTFDALAIWVFYSLG